MAKAKTNFDGKKVMQAVKKGNFTSLEHAGAAIRLFARRSIKKSAKPAAIGSPPHTRKGRLKNAIKFAASRALQNVVIGPDYAVAADSGRAHEFGGRFRREHYDARPFMGPALQQAKPRLPGFWLGSVR